MDIIILNVFILLSISQYQCLTPSCKTNCTIDEGCWRDALVYHSSELIERLFSFSSLVVHVDAFQREHTSKLNDSIVFVDKTFEKHLSAESNASNLTVDVFKTTVKQLIDLCVNLTVDPIESVGELPSLVCLTSTCSGDKLSYMMFLIISILTTSAVIVICIAQFYQTYNRAKAVKLKLKRVSKSFSSPINSESVE